MQDGVAAQGGRTADVAYDVKGYMTTPARPRGAKGATDRAPVPVRRRRRLRTVLTVVIAAGAALVAGVAGVDLIRSAWSSQPAAHHAAAGPGAARSALSRSAAGRPRNQRTPPAPPPLSPPHLPR